MALLIISNSQTEAVRRIAEDTANRSELQEIDDITSLEGRFTQAPGTPLASGSGKWERN